MRDPNDIFLFRTGSDEKAAGALTGKRLIAMGVKGGVVVADQQPGDATCRDRADSEIATLKAAGVKAEFLETSMDPGQESEAVVNYLRKHPGHCRGDQRLQHQRRPALREERTAARRT